MNILETTIAYLADVLDVPVSADVPAERPEAFVTVERSGGSMGRHDDWPTMTVQAWDVNRLRLESLASDVEAALIAMPDSVVPVYSTEVTKTYFPLLVGARVPRYVLTCGIHCHR